MQLSEELAIAHLLELPDPIGRLQELPAAKVFATAHESGERMQLDDDQSTTAATYCIEKLRAISANGVYELVSKT